MAKIENDLSRIADMEFTVVRIGFHLQISGSTIQIPTGSKTTFFSLVQDLLDDINDQGLKAILVVGPNGANTAHEDFKIFLEDFANEFK
ncbi:MAG: hypothetical protein J7L96_08075, partial [Bacteroidales bacterium]|nr:hypothetical protein [Bacteroidales bacterium]